MFLRTSKRSDEDGTDKRMSGLSRLSLARGGGGAWPHLKRNGNGLFLSTSRSSNKYPAVVVTQPQLSQLEEAVAEAEKTRREASEYLQELIDRLVEMSE